jgi:hypothetical protein
VASSQELTPIVRISPARSRMACTNCGAVGVDVRPNWKELPPRRRRDLYPCPFPPSLGEAVSFKVAPPRAVVICASCLVAKSFASASTVSAGGPSRSMRWSQESMAWQQGRRQFPPTEYAERIGKRPPQRK